MNVTRDIKKFFTDNPNVWTSENFQSLVLGSYIENNSVSLGETSYVDLQNAGTLLIANSVFRNVHTLLDLLAALIQQQINGEVGELLNDSSANYFFLQTSDGKYYSILVRFEPAQKLWRCGAYLQETLKMPNVRIFLPETNNN